MDDIITDRVKEEVGEKLAGILAGAVSELAQGFGQAQDFCELEGRIYELVCRTAREALAVFLAQLDERLAAGGGRHDRRRCELLTRFGLVVFRRSRMRDGRYPLDEALGLFSGRMRVSPWLVEQAVRWAAKTSYRPVAEWLNEWVPEAGLSHQAVHDWVQRYGELRAAEEEALREEVYGHGRGTDGRRNVPVFFLEGDGVNIALQREKSRRGELKLVLGYEGLEPASPTGRRWRAVKKQALAGVYNGNAIWEHARVKFGRTYAFREETQVILGGDGAGWIQAGLEYFPGGEYVLCRYHLRKAIDEALRGHPEAAESVWQLARTGEWDRLQAVLEALLESLPGKEREGIEGLRRYLTGNSEGLADYWRRGLDLPEGTRGLGIMEANNDKLLANRFKKRGRRWTYKGAHHLAKMAEYEYANELSEWLRTHRRLRPFAAGKKIRHPFKELEETLPEDLASRVAAHLPAFDGPNRTWVKILRSFVA